MSQDRVYLFSLDYGNRLNEQDFVRAVLSNFDRNSLTGSTLFVNNNPYCFELLWFVNFQKDHGKFDKWLLANYQKKRRIYNRTLDDLHASIAGKSYNIRSINEAEDVGQALTPHESETFLFPDRTLLFSIWGKPIIMPGALVFLSHSSLDKALVGEVFSELQKQSLKVWFDQEEILPGDSITEKLNDGLSRSDIGVIFLSKNFLQSPSGWTEAEMNFFFQRRMRDPSKLFIVVNLDVSHQDLPPLIQDYRYIDASKGNVADNLIKAIQKRIE